MTTRLHQIVAVHKTAASNAGTRLADLNRKLQKLDLLTGISRVNRPYNDATPPLPEESTKVQYTVPTIVDHLIDALTPYWDLTATRDYADTEACANLVVDGNVLLRDAPVDYLLFLENQLAEIKKIVRAIPTLPLSEEWHDTGDGTWHTGELETKQMAKAPLSVVKWAPPDPSYRQEAQTELHWSDSPVGTWKIIKFSGAMHPAAYRLLVKRLDILIEAVKMAREEANSIEVTHRKVAEPILNYLLGPVVA